MKTSLFAKMSSLAVVSAFSAAAVADTLLLGEHRQDKPHAIDSA